MLNTEEVISESKLCPALANLKTGDIITVGFSPGPLTCLVINIIYKTKWGLNLDLMLPDGSHWKGYVNNKDVAIRSHGYSTPSGLPYIYISAFDCHR